MLQQIEILIEGLNPVAAGALSDRELDRLRRVLPEGEPLAAFLRGRVVGAGAGLWALTPRRVVAVGMRPRSAISDCDLAQLQSLTVERGRYGSTVAVVVAGQRNSMFAAEPSLAHAFATALQRCAPALALTEALPAVSDVDAAEAALWIAQSRARLQPGVLYCAGDAVVMLREAAELHAAGVLNDAEFGAVKDKLLKAA